MNLPNSESTPVVSDSQPSSSRSPQLCRFMPWIVTSMIVGGGGMVLWHFLLPDRNVASSQTTAPEVPPRPVETVILTQGDSVQTVELIGQVEAQISATIRAQTEGVVQQVLVEPGDAVSAGMAIAILDDADQQLALSQSQASLASQQSNLVELQTGTRPEIIEQRRAAVSAAEAREQAAIDNLQRTEALVTEGALSERSLIEAKSTVDAAQSERLEAAAALAEAVEGPRQEEIAAQQAMVAASQAAVNQARLALQRTRIQAPTAGVVQSRIANVGDYLEVGDSVMALVARGTLDIFLEVPEELSGQVTPGMSVILSSRALPDWQDTATIAGVVPTADEASRRQRVRVQLDSPPTNLLPGMAIQGQMEQPIDASGFVVSRDALVQRSEQWMVFAVADDQADAIAVDLVADMGEQVAIASPELRDGQLIVVTGSEGLQDGATIQIQN
ncbi:MAG: efflux RND transporter periplasmic adaptor subunit [Elainellaceae cyanobacterium]